MKICHTINCQRTDKEFDEFEKLYQERIFQGVEIFYPYNTNLEQKNLYTKRLESLKKYDLEFVMHLPHGPKNNLLKETLEENEESFNRMIEAIDYAFNFNVHKLTLHLGQSFGYDIDALTNVLFPILSKLSSYAKSKGMVIMVENMPGKNEIGASPCDLLKIFSSLENEIFFILDTGHAHLSGYAIESYIYLLKDYLKHIHFNDNSGARDEHNRIGFGTINFDSIFYALNNINFKELHCLEIIFNNTSDLVLYHSDIINFIKYYNK